MQVEVRVFAALRDVFGAERFAVDLPEGATGADLRAHLAAGHPRWSDLIRVSRLARGVEFLADTEPLAEGAEIVLIPPVSGGAPAAGPPPGGDGSPAAGTPSEAALTRDPLDAATLVRAARRHAAGAVVSFEGTVRSPSEGRRVDFLDYEAYDEMALASMKEALEEIRARWDVTAAFLHHRLGRVEVGETSVVAVVSAPHREDAFAACRYLIERLKKDIPIWKREATDEGTRWVGTPPPDPER